MQEKLERERQERLQQARDAAKAREENTRTSQTDAGNASPGDFYQFLKDPDVVQAFQVSGQENHTKSQALVLMLSYFIGKYLNNYVTLDKKKYITISDTLTTIHRSIFINKE